MAEKESPITCLTDADVPKGRRCAVCAQGWKSRVCQNTRALAKATDQQRSKWRAEKTEEEALAAGGGRSRRSSRPESTLLREQARQLEAGSDGEEEDYSFSLVDSARGLPQEPEAPHCRAAHPYRTTRAARAAHSTVRSRGPRARATLFRTARGGPPEAGRGDGAQSAGVQAPDGQRGGAAL